MAEKVVRRERQQVQLQQRRAVDVQEHLGIRALPEQPRIVASPQEKLREHRSPPAGGREHQRD